MRFENPIVNEINDKFQALKTERDNLRNEMSSLNNKVSELKQHLELKEKSLEELKQQYNVMKLAKSLDGGEVEGKKDLKLKINEMVRELDKCIALLNK